MTKNIITYLSTIQLIFLTTATENFRTEIIFCKISLFIIAVLFYNIKTNHTLQKKGGGDFFVDNFCIFKSHNSTKTTFYIFFNFTAFSTIAILMLRNLEELKQIPTKYLFVTVVLFYNNKANGKLKKKIIITEKETFLRDNFCVLKSHNSNKT